MSATDKKHHHHHPHRHHRHHHLKTATPVDLADAASWTARWREVNKKGENIYPPVRTAYTVSLEDFNAIVRDQEVTAIRFYFGLDRDVPHIILVGVNGENKDICTYNGESAIYDLSHPCPSTCDHTSLLSHMLE